MRTVAEEYDRVVGVDTHAATHTMSLLIAATGAVVEHRNFRPARPGCVEPSPGSATAPRTGPVWSWSKALVPTGRG